MRILFVGMSSSVHLARWVSHLDGMDWERFLFPVHVVRPHAALRGMTIINSSEVPGMYRNRALRYKNDSLPFFAMNFMDRVIRKRVQPGQPPVIPSPFLVRALTKTIKQLKPDIVHSMEFQEAGYLTLEVKKQFGESFPKWIATNWGSDIYLFGRLAGHHERVRAVLQHCDYYSCECHRDVILAREYGLRGDVLPVIPNSGGFDLDQCGLLRMTGNVSERKLILLKGYQGWAGRALSGLRALARCADILKSRGYSVAVYSSSADVDLALELFSHETGVPIEIIPPSSHTDMLKRYGQARVYLGLSISDAISTSLLEAMVMGAFPIQSCTACADEWIVDGQSGMIVPPEDVDIIEQALRRALTDDVLVDQASIFNQNTARERLDSSTIRPQVIDFYRQVYNSKKDISL
jgi:glycosyltransferase involved in cell wall biosynthesis